MRPHAGGHGLRDVALVLSLALSAVHAGGADADAHVSTDAGAPTLTDRAGALTARAGAPTVNISIAGEPVIIWSAVDTLHKCGFIDVPDIPYRAWAAAGGVTHAMVGATAYHLMSGPSLLNQTRECAFAYNSTDDGDPSHFAGDEFLDSPVFFPNNGTVFSLVHTEYPGNVYKNCTGPAYPHCWTVSIGLAVSHDGGRTFAHARPPPAHLVAAVPYTYNASQLAYGWGDPSNVLFRDDGFYYAAVWNRNAVGLQAPGVCIMRTADVTDPSSWRAWGGAAYDVPFADPYTLPPGTEAAHVCVVTNLPSCPLGSLVFSAPLRLYLASMDCSLQAGAKFYYATSSDLISWSAPQPLYAKSDLPANASKLVTSMSYPAFLDPAGGDANFGVIGSSPLLSWVSIGHSPYTDGRKLWATPFSVTAAGGS